MAALCVSAVGATVAVGETPWWNSRWRYRTVVARPAPFRDSMARPVEACVDASRLLESAGLAGTFDPGSVRVVAARGEADPGRDVPYVWRTEHDPESHAERPYLCWLAQPQPGQTGEYHVYFDTVDRQIGHVQYALEVLPPENLLTNPGFDEVEDGLPSAWHISGPGHVKLGRFRATTGPQALNIAVRSLAPQDEGLVTVKQSVDVTPYAGLALVFECDLMADQAVYGLPMSVELRQYRKDGSRILEYAIEPRRLSLELAPGHLVQFRERGRCSHEAARVEVCMQFRCTARDADTGAKVTGPDSDFSFWLDRVVLRPGERWPWPSASAAGFVDGALAPAPVNRAFEFTGRRRLVFNGASEGALTANRTGDAQSVHWGLAAGTIEFWCSPKWSSDDGAEHIFFDSSAYGHRRQARLRKRDQRGGNQLEFMIAAADGKARTVAGPAELQAGQWHHLAATWDFAAAHLQLFVDGARIAAHGPGDTPWRHSLAHGDGKGERGIGISDTDSRSMPMQAFIGGDKSWTTRGSAKALIDEFRVSDVVRYQKRFVLTRSEFAVDASTRALFHFENEPHGTHASDDCFVRGNLACELPPQCDAAALDILQDGQITRRSVVVNPYPSDELFEANRVDRRLTVTRPFTALPDPRFIEWRERCLETSVVSGREAFAVEVAGDFQPLMRSVTFERAGQQVGQMTHIPRWRANDNVVPFSAASIAATLAATVTDDAEKAVAVFKYAAEVTNYYDAHYCETLPTRHRSRVSYTLIKALNIYPFDQCGPMNHMLRKLFLAAGISSSNASGTHHQFEQVFYGGHWRLFDLSSRKFWLRRDNKAIAGRPDVEDDPWLKLREDDSANAWLRGRSSCATFGTAERPHSMDFGLRAGERVSFCWHNEGRWFELTEQRTAIPLAKIPPYFGNGALLYVPTAGGEGTRLENVSIEADADGTARVSATAPGSPAMLIYEAQCPYIFSDALVTGSCEASAQGAVAVSLSFDHGEHWQCVWRNSAGPGPFRVEMREHVSARYEYWLRLELGAGGTAAVRGFRVRSTFVVSPLSLPGTLALGTNRVQMVHAVPTVPLRTVCRWVERHRTDVGVSLNAVSYYMDSDRAHRNVFVSAPGEPFGITVTLFGAECRGVVRVEGLPVAWRVDSASQRVTVVAEQPAAVQFTVSPGKETPGSTRGFAVVLSDGERERRIPAQVLVAEAPLVREAEAADEITGDAAVAALAGASNAHVVRFSGAGAVALAFSASAAGTRALWFRARWERGSSTAMTLTLDGEERKARAQAMIGFTDWHDGKRAHTKMFAHYGEQYAHWSWYRLPDVQLAAGEHRLSLALHAGAELDAVLLLPQNPELDRAAMDLFQNWNYAPWDNPL